MKIRRTTGFLILSLLTAFLLSACGGGGSDSSPAPPAPTVTTSGASAITTDNAVLSGMVNPKGLATTAWFEWGNDNTLSSPNVTVSQPVGSGTTDNTFNQLIPGLTAGTKYYYRAAASSTAGTVLGEIFSFMTAAPLSPPSVQTLPADSVTTTSADLHGTVIPNGLATNAWFQWGTDNTWVTFSETPFQPIGNGTSSVAVNATLSSGISAATTYYFRMVAQNSADPSTGSPVSFTTPQNPPPTADAGPDQQLYRYGPFGLNTVTLDASGSSDPYGIITSYEWTQIAGTAVTLSDNTAINPTFTVPEVASPGEDLQFQLTVTDNRGLSGTDNVTISVLWAYLDDFSSDSTGTYNVFPGAGATFSYMAGAGNIRVLTGSSNLEFNHIFGDSSQPLPFQTDTGVYSFDFDPRDQQPGGGMAFTLSEDGQSYYSFSTLTGRALKVRGGTVVDNVAFPTSYATYTEWPIRVTFTPAATTVEAFGQTIYLTAGEPGVPVFYYSVTLDKQDADFDNFKLEAIP